MIMSEKVKKYLLEAIPLIGVVIAVLLIKWLVVTPIQVKGNSMSPTLEENDIMILNKISYKIHGIKRFDVVVIDNDDSLLIKRVIGLPGETIKFEDNKLYVNGEFVEQDFLDSSKMTEDFQVKIEEGYYFVMGDNRDISRDSREFGAFPYEKIQGTTSLIVFPFNRFGK